MFGKSSHSNVDGFVVRRRNSGKPTRLGTDNAPLPEQFLASPRLKARQDNKNQSSGQQQKTQRTSYAATAAAPSRSHSELSNVLSQLPSVDLPKESKKKKRFLISKKAIKRFFIAAALILFLAGGYVGIKFIVASGRVFDGNLFAAFLNDGKELQKDQYGRVNVLIFGTSEDDADHEGADLTDSIMIASINPTDKTGFLMSIPRDLWVKYGQACSSGYEGRINVLYQCGKEEGGNEEGAALLKGVVEESLGIDIQYHVSVNYTALRQSVDAVGGITVNIESEDPRGVLDRNFDWKCRYRCHYVKWPNGPANLNGEQALALARARNAAGGYGLSGGNFDREQYQQKIIIALKEKASSAGVLANPVAVTNLLDSLGDNVRTNFDAGEVKTLVKLAQELDAKQLKRISLVDEQDPLVTTGNVQGQSIVRPVAGVYDFSEIQSVLKAHMSGDTALLEAATVDVLNGSGTAGAAQKKADELEAQGYSVGEVGNAPAGDRRGLLLYDLSGGKKQATKAKLQKALGVSTVGSADTLPSGVVTDADFVVIIGIDGSR